MITAGEKTVPDTVSAKRKTTAAMRFGLIGAGGIGKVRVKALKSMSDCELTAIADIDRQRAQALAPSPRTKVFGDYQSLLASDSVDAVVVSTPPQFHEEIVIAALEAGKPTLCEKPLSNTVESCRRMVEASRRTGITLATGFNHRYYHAVEFVKDALNRGLIGELDHVRAFGGHVGLGEFKAPWMYDKQVIGGGALMDVGIHIIDLVRYLLGEVAEVYGVATHNIWKLGASEDNAVAVLRSPQGKLATLQATWSEWKGYRLSIEAYGSKGMARAFYAPMFHMAVFQDKPGAARRRQLNFYTTNIVKEKIFGWQLTAAKAFQKEFRDFVGLCEGRKVNIADGFSGFRAVEIATAVYRSSSSGQSVRLTPPF